MTMSDEKFNEMIFNILFACGVIFIIMLPKLCFRVSEKDY